MEVTDSFDAALPAHCTLPEGVAHRDRVRRTRDTRDRIIPARSRDPVCEVTASWATVRYFSRPDVTRNLVAS
jgi:hypothetical protein